jgi:SAM-dependent methyltransferase
MEMTHTKHWYPRATAQHRPSPLWYFGWAAYVNRRGYLRALAAGAPVAGALAVAGVALGSRALLAAAAALVAGGAAVFLFSLAGIYRMYGPPAARYVRRLLRTGDVGGRAVVADLHIGTWRTSHLLGELLPRATIWSVDCWDEAGPPSEANVRQLHELEPPPAHPPFGTLALADGAVPLPDASCDAVVLGFGIHEIPAGGPRERLFDEARRLLRPGGKLLLFEHLVDLENFAIFGPGIDHWPRRRDWLRLLAARFGAVRHERASQAVDLFVAAAPGNFSRVQGKFS